MLLLLSLLACSTSVKIPTDDADTAIGSDGADTADTGTDSGDSGDSGADTAEEADPRWDGATLRILRPASGAFLPYGERSDFEAVIVDADGEEMDFDDIQWSSDIDDGWSPLGAAFEDDSLEPGVHALTATAALPNGDRLAYTIGGVRVQSPYTGIYTGTLIINAQYDTYAVGCSGAATLTVDLYGEVVTGSSSCVLTLGTWPIDSRYDFDLTNDDGDLSGIAAANLVLFSYDMEATGGISDPDGDGALTLSFADTVSIGTGSLDIEGNLDAVRVSRTLE